MASTSASRVAGFDRHITVFSPEGRLYQVEYAFKAVVSAESLTAVGVRGRTGVVLISPRRKPDPLVVDGGPRHVYALNEAIGACVTGRVSDGLALVHKARQEAAEYEYRYGVPVPPESLARRLANVNQVATQEASVRPLGVSLTLGGVEDDGTVALYRCDPAGYYVGYGAVATGPKSTEMMAAFERLLTPENNNNSGSRADEDAVYFGETIDDTLSIALKTLQSTLATAFKAEELEIGVASVQDRRFRILSTAKVHAALDALKHN
jgi:20S proteasome subunit alpha 1